MNAKYFSPEYNPGSYLQGRYDRVLFFQREKYENHNAKSVEFIPTGKGNPCSYRLCKVKPQAVFGKIVLAGAAVFSRKTLHIRNTDLCLPVE